MHVGHFAAVDGNVGEDDSNELIAGEDDDNMGGGGKQRKGQGREEGTREVENAECYRRRGSNPRLSG